VSSILDDVKHALGLLPAGTAFDSDVIMHINSAFATLNQLGVGPGAGFQIEDDSAEWDAFIDDPRLNSVRSYIYLKVKLLLDPPQVGFVISSMDRQMAELEFRLMIASEGPYIPAPVILDGGGA
jgi:hypothetical protein